MTWITDGHTFQVFVDGASWKIVVTCPREGKEVTFNDPSNECCMIEDKYVSCAVKEQILDIGVEAAEGDFALSPVIPIKFRWENSEEIYFAPADDA